MKTKLFYYFAIYLLCFTASGLFGQWTVYDGSTLLENATPYWTKFKTTAGETDGPTSVLASVVDDPEIEGNKLLKIEELDGDKKESWQLEWPVDDPNTGLTLVFRSKPTEGILASAPTNGFESDNWYLWVSPRNGAFREGLMYTYPNQLLLNQSDTAITHTETDWVIYRLTLKNDVSNLYLNEDPMPVLSDIVSPKTDTDIHLMLGDNDKTPYGSYFDWVIWDLSGAYAPGEGEELPDSLTGLPEPPESIGTLTLNDRPVNIYPNPLSSKTKITFFVSQTSLTSLDIYDITGKHISNLLNKVMQYGTYEVDFDASTLPSGIYLCKFKTGNKLTISKMLRE